MYTGITRGTYPVINVRRKPDLSTYVVELDAALSSGLETGGSGSIDGVCQTVTGISGQNVTFDAIRETLDLTTLETLEVGRKVAVERSARVGDEVGGPAVAGHVTGTGVVCEVHREGDVFDMQIEVPADWMSAIFSKGFIAVDGSSLTVGEVTLDGTRGRFRIHLIPETLRLTNLGNKP